MSPFPIQRKETFILKKGVNAFNWLIQCNHFFEPRSRFTCVYRLQYNFPKAQDRVCLLMSTQGQKVATLHSDRIKKKNFTTFPKDKLLWSYTKCTFLSIYIHHFNWLPWGTVYIFIGYVMHLCVAARDLRKYGSVRFQRDNKQNWRGRGTQFNRSNLKEDASRWWDSQRLSFREEVRQPWCQPTGGVRPLQCSPEGAMCAPLHKASVRLQP